MGGRRIDIPKKREDVERIMREVEEHAHVHHHAHGSLPDSIAMLELMLDSINAKISVLESRIERQTLEIARLYRLLSHIVEAVAPLGDERTARALEDAIREMEESGGKGG